MSDRSSSPSVKKTLTGVLTLTPGAEPSRPNKDLVSNATSGAPSVSANHVPVGSTGSVEAVSLVCPPETISAHTVPVMITAPKRFDAPTVPTITASTAPVTITDPKGLQGHELNATTIPPVQATSANSSPEFSTPSVPGTTSSSTVAPYASANAAKGGPRPFGVFGGGH